ncbi:ogr/Delta-like zinc finger family protein [Azotobacter beijerinckii]|uniref:ogr/Delta-like zinc finger family protein n=1 Tax=Azotobacter beijerinckii TaxID=170623 RepID=UPI000B824E64|nr:ogr/Delta-like zinc finger family protein [Azotobacter beijerinckii]
MVGLKGGGGYKIICPHCGNRMRIRTSEGVHIFLRIIYLQCGWESCGWGVRVEFTMTHQMSASGDPKPGVVLPLGTAEMRRASLLSYQKPTDQLDIFDQMESQ